MLAVSAGALSKQPFLEKFSPAAEFRTLVTNFLIIISAVTVVVGVWGIGTYKVTHRIFTTVYGMGVTALTVILIGFAFIFWTLANLDMKIM